jgi:hypothetical protein
MACNTRCSTAERNRLTDSLAVCTNLFTGSHDVSVGMVTSYRRNYFLFAKYVRSAQIKRYFSWGVVNGIRSLFFTLHFRLNTIRYKGCALAAVQHLCYASSSFRQPAFCYGCQWKYICVCLVQLQVKNALAKAVHATDCTTCSLTRLLQRCVIEVYCAAYRDVPLGLSVSTSSSRRFET